MTVRIDDRLAAGFGRRELWDLLDELGAREPMLVGHDPDLSELLGYLIDAAGVPLPQGRARDGRRRACSRQTSSGTLRWLVPPDLLEKPRAATPAPSGDRDREAKRGPGARRSTRRQMRPPWASAMWRAMARPRPVPPWPALTSPVDLVEALEDPRLLGLGMPSPWSVTEIDDHAAVLLARRR